MSGIQIMHVTQVYEALDDKRWLELAVSDWRPNYQIPHGGIGTDGIRMHITADAVHIPGNETSEKIFDMLETDKVKAAPMVFAVQRQFLLEALAGLGDPDGEHFDDFDSIVFFNEGPEKPIVMQVLWGGKLSKRAAVIMPVDPESFSQKKPILPQRAPATPPTQEAPKE